jgi:hypothetical protein
MEQRARLHLVRNADLRTVSEGSGGSDVGLLVFVLAVNLIPIGATLAGGRWSDGSLGFATLVSILCVRELLHELRARRVPARR